MAAGESATSVLAACSRSARMTQTNHLTVSCAGSRIFLTVVAVRYRPSEVLMDKGPQEAFDTMRKQLQLILARAELCQNPPHCESCATIVCQIVEEIRALEAFVSKTVTKGG